MDPEPGQLQALTRLWVYHTNSSRCISQHNKIYFVGFTNYNLRLSPAAVKPVLALIHTATYCPTTETTQRTFSQIQTTAVHLSK